MSFISLSDQNPDLFRLPQSILHADNRINNLLAQLEHSELSLAEKMEIVSSLELEPFVTGLPLSPDFRLLIKVADDLGEIRYYRINRELSKSELNESGYIDFSPEDLTELVCVSNPTLIYSPAAITKVAGPAELDCLFQLMSWGKRISEYRGVQVTWDQSVDKRVWTTNIDTVNIINELMHTGLYEKSRVKRVLEIGVGGGAISKTLLSLIPDIETLVATDICSYALACTRRNILPILKESQQLELYLGKGIKGINTTLDLIVVNPPYVPTVLPPDTLDPYRGTGLIKEVIEIGLDLLDPENPDAAIFMGLSSLAESDLHTYLESNPQVKFETIGKRRRVPLKIFKVGTNEEWVNFLVEKCGLEQNQKSLESEGYEFWHEIFLAKLSAKG